MAKRSKSNKALDVELAFGEAELNGQNRPFLVRHCLEVLLKTPPSSQMPSEDCNWLRSLVEGRFKQRFIQPIKLILGSELDVKVGFSTLALCSLLVETLACFEYGQWTTSFRGANPDPRWGSKVEDALGKGWRPAGSFKDMSGKSYRGRYPEFLLKLASRDGTKLFQNEGDAQRYYSGIRCGILHQAETVGWKVRSTDSHNPGIDMREPQIDPWKFFWSLERVFAEYCERLKEPASPLWRACRYKLLGVCRKAGWNGNHADQPVDFAAYSP